jgi:hypothetical protein
MILTTVILKFLAFCLFARWPGVALCAMGVSLLPDVVISRRLGQESRSRVSDSLERVVLINISCLLICVLLNDLCNYVLVRHKEGLPIAAELLRLCLNAIGIAVCRAGGTLHLSTMAGALAFPVTLDSLGVKPSVMFVGLCLPYLLVGKVSKAEAMRSMALLGLLAIGAAILRSLFSVCLFLFTCNFVGYETEELPAGPFLDPDVVALSLIPFLVLFVPLIKRAGILSISPNMATVATLPAAERNHIGAYLGVALLAVLFFWEPQGKVRQGRVLIDTWHTEWSKTNRPYDKTWFGPTSGYNYYCAMELLRQFYQVDELAAPFSEGSLDGASLLVIYVPNRPFTDKERDVILRFVGRGGGLFLIGDHTNIFGSSSHLNSICKDLGFLFRDDVLFDIEKDFFQIAFPGTVRSPLLRGVDFFKFRGACSIDPVSPFASTVMEIDRTKSLRAIYWVNNFYPPPHDHPKMKAGRFAVAVTARYGKGRVLGFGDSTVFSNFEVFCPGKYEFLLNSINWLAHENMRFAKWVRPSSAVAMVIVGIISILRIRRTVAVLQFLVVSVGLCYGVLYGVTLAKNSTLKLPALREEMRTVFLAVNPDDENYELKVFYSRADYVRKYDVFMQWILRNRMFPAFYLAGKRNSHYFYDQLGADPSAKRAVAFVVKDKEGLRSLKRTDPDLFKKNRRFLFVVASGVATNDFCTIVSEMELFDRQDIAVGRKCGDVDNAVVVSKAGKNYVVVFSGERFSDRYMGYSERVEPTDEQKALYEKEYRVLDEVFSEM